MAANSHSPLIIILFLACSILASSCSAESKAHSNDVLDHVSRNLLKATASYTQRIEFCSQRVSQSQAPKLDAKKLSDLNLTRQDSVVALGYLKFRNDFLCERDARIEFAFHLGTMKSLKLDLAVNDSAIAKVESLVCYPSQKELELEVKYLKLSAEVRNYFELAVGSDPFDLVGALQANQLFRD